MKRALLLAEQAAKEQEVPVGAVITKDGEIIGEGRNRREKEGNAVLHAEIVAIEQACKRLGSWRLHECKMYVTLEPCAMCAGAVSNARISRLIFGAYDEKAGACVSVTNLFEFPIGHRPTVVGGYMQKESTEILKQFFSGKR